MRNQLANTPLGGEKSYSEIDDGNFKGALWIFKQQLISKRRVRCGISILLL